MAQAVEHLSASLAAPSAEHTGAQPLAQAVAQWPPQCQQEVACSCTAGKAEHKGLPRGIPGPGAAHPRGFGAEGRCSSRAALCRHRFPRSSRYGCVSGISWCELRVPSSWNNPAACSPALSLLAGDLGSAVAGGQRIAAPRVAGPRRAPKAADPCAATPPPAETCHLFPVPRRYELGRDCSPLLPSVSRR